MVWQKTFDEILVEIKKLTAIITGGKTPVTGPLTAAERTAQDPATSAKQQPPATTHTMDYITIAVINTEYSKALPANCKSFSFRCIDITDPDKPVAGDDIRYAFETGKVATPVLPYGLLEGGAVYSEDNLNLTSNTFYVAGVTAGNIVLLEMWS